VNIDFTHCAHKGIYALASNVTYNTPNYTLSYIDTSSGEIHNFAGMYLDGPWNVASTFDQKNSILYVHLMEDFKSKSTLYEFDINAKKLKNTYNLGLFKVYEMYWDGDQDRVVLLATFLETKDPADEIKYVLSFPTSNCSNIQVIANITAIIGPASQFLKTVFDKTNNILYMIYGDFSIVLSALKLDNPSAGLKTIPFNDFSALPADRGFYDDVTGNLILIYYARNGYDYYVYEVNPFIEGQKSLIARINPPPNMFLYLGYSAFDFTSRILYLAGTSWDTFLVSVDIDNHNYEFLPFNPVNYYYMLLLEVQC